MCLNGTLIGDKKTHLGNVNVRILASKSVPFRPTTMQRPNLAQIETKRIIVCQKTVLLEIEYRGYLRIASKLKKNMIKRTKIYDNMNRTLSAI
jgi:hypothetical protein